LYIYSHHILFLCLFGAFCLFNENFGSFHKQSHQAHLHIYLLLFVHPPFTVYPLLSKRLIQEPFLLPSSVPKYLPPHKVKEVYT
jgi:hypothetical protein